MNTKKGNWPNPDDLKSKSAIPRAPYGVLAEYAESVYEAYDKKLIGIITTAFQDNNGSRTDFTYGLYIAKVVSNGNGPQIKILELKVQDDGWYDAKLSILFPFRKEMGIAKSESELDELIKKAIVSDEVKSIIVQLLE